MVFFKATTTTGPDEPTIEQCKTFDFAAPAIAEVTTTTTNSPTTPVVVPSDSNTLSEELRHVQQGEYSNYAAKTLIAFAGWSYSDFDTFKDMIADTVGPNIETMMIQVKNEPMLVQATAQMIRTKDKKVVIVVFRGTELTNLVNWVTDAIAKKSDFYKLKKKPDGSSTPENHVKVHTGFKRNFENVWKGRKGILMHLLNPEMIRKDYDYEKSRTDQGIPSEQDDLEAIYICGHSLGGAMAFLAGLWLGAFSNGLGPFSNGPKLFSKLRGVYTYGSPMVVHDHDRARCQDLCGNVTFRHVYYNDIVPHLPPLSTGSFDHVGPEYRYHPHHGWKKRKEGGLGFKSGRATQVGSILLTAPIGALDGILDNLNALNFFRGDDRDWPVIGIFSRGYLKMPWSFLDHSPVGYNASLMKLKDGESLDK